MLRTLSRAGSCSSSLLRPSASCVRAGASSRSSLASSSVLSSWSSLPRRHNATTSEGASEEPSGSASGSSEVPSVSEVEEVRERTKRVPIHPTAIRLPPYREMFNSSGMMNRAADILANLDRDASTQDKPDQARQELRRLGRRMGPSQGLMKFQVSLMIEIVKTANAALPAHRAIVIQGPVSWEASVSSTHPRLAVVSTDRATALPATVADKAAELELLVPALKAAGISAHVRNGVLRAHFMPTPEQKAKAPSRGSPNKVTLSHQPSPSIIANAIVASYMALSPDVLVPLFRAVTSIPCKIEFSSTAQIDNARAVLCICYLQSLPQELLPRLSNTALVREFGLRRMSVEVPKGLTGSLGSAKVDYTFVPIGVSPKTLEKAGFMDEDKEVKFVRTWRNKPTPALSELVSGFFYWYAGEVSARFDWERDVVSVKGRQTRAQADPDGLFAKDSMVILDPLNPYINLAAGFTHSKAAINEAFIEGLRDELVAGAVKLEDLLPRKSSSPPSLTPKAPTKPRELRPKRAAAEKKDANPAVTAGVEALEAAVPQETTPESVKMDAKVEAEGLAEQVKAKAEEIKETVGEKVEQAKETVSEKVEQAKEFVEEKTDEARK